MKPLIGVTGREFAYGKVEGGLPILADSMIDAVMTDYIDAVLASGGLPVHIPLRVDPADVIDRLDGLVLSGGADVEPERYGASPVPEVTTIEPERDEFELRLTKIALERSLPTLGVCRGNQVINVALGGTLKQHIPVHEQLDSPPDVRVHDVKIVDGTILSQLYGSALPVNSLHHQGIDDVGHGIRIAATSPDGVVEGIEVEGKPMIGIQWHPEMYREREPIFDWLIETSSNR